MLVVNPARPVPLKEIEMGVSLRGIVPWEKVINMTRRRSGSVKLVLLTAVAAVVTAAGCDDDSEQIVHCVDQDGIVVDSTLCNPQPTDAAPTHNRGGFMFYHVYHTTFHPVGADVIGGSRTPLLGKTIVTHPQFSARSGGFGGTGRHFGMAGG